MNIKQDRSHSAIEHAQAKARAIAVPMNIAVVDSGGHLKEFLRMDGAVLGSIDIALKKAKTAILFGANSEVIWDYCKPGGTSPGLEATNDGLIPFAGGIPLRNESGEIIGAIGVSGGTVEQDYAVALAGTSADQ
jgi:uncharacterized protein GlcG (DUF336 family)